MSGERAFLDWNAGAPMGAAARAALIDALGRVGNASSVHAEGRAARSLVEGARRSVAALVGADPERVLFTSGGTEANATALTPDHKVGGKPFRARRLFVSAVEHPSVLAGGRFAAEDVETLPVDGAGRLDLATLERRLAAFGGDVLVSLMAANNETGVIEPVAKAAALVKAAGGLLHVDAVQAVGKIPVSAAALGADYLTISAHKIGGPQGVGALVLAAPDTEPVALLTGGGQERRRRAGTEPVALLAGFGAAAAEISEHVADGRAVRRLRDWLEGRLDLICPATVIFGREAERLPGTVSFAVDGVSAETAMIALDLAGVAVSSGSACSSGKVLPSHVLAAMGVAASLAKGAIRVSFGWSTTEGDLARFVEAWTRLVERLGLAGTRNAA